MMGLQLHQTTGLEMGLCCFELMIHLPLAN